jgi:putative transposase
MLDFTDRKALRAFLKENDIKDVVQVDELVKKLSGMIIEELLEAERDEHLGYEKYDTSKKDTDNSRNGYSKKTVRVSQGEMDLSIPRDRKGKFEPQIVKKHETDISKLAAKIISMYAKGMTVRDIQSHVSDIYGAEISPQTISNMTDRILPLLEEWRNRTLEEIYSVVYIDGIRYKVRDNGTIKTKTIYGVIGIDLEGRKDVLGLWISETESAKYWLHVLTDLKNRGVKDVLLVTSDDLPGITDAIKAVYPEAEYQGCVVHVIRNSLKYMYPIRTGKPSVAP